ncbi:hypothetical protein [Persicirhabdus sediminis]|uniref:Uncharacterized protein n=1 Tax=Persicirhabdus sediminis TaxID=454144 RepID=A0A8J7MHD7_9BACT|nr:hypothetical protein [Persicirhabdus sediminis]MBK1792863.1 hypothetical protein [Persicirhabdus sediminis]
MSSVRELPLIVPNRHFKKIRRNMRITAVVSPILEALAGITFLAGYDIFIPLVLFCISQLLNKAFLLDIDSVENKTELAGKFAKFQQLCIMLPVFLIIIWLYIETKALAVIDYLAELRTDGQFFHWMPILAVIIYFIGESLTQLKSESQLDDMYLYQSLAE